MSNRGSHVCHAMCYEAKLFDLSEKRRPRYVLKKDDLSLSIQSSKLLLIGQLSFYFKYVIYLFSYLFM